MFYAGIDLAWSPKNKTGIAILEGDKKKSRLVHHTILQTDQEILDTLDTHIRDKPAIIAIDAPLVVPNPK